MGPPKSTTKLLQQLRSLMQNKKYVKEPISAYIVPSSDAHNSEYLAECDEYRAFISGFTGSAGTAIITDKEALLWTDGRYYLQASEQLDSNWVLMKEGLPTTLTQGDWLSKNLIQGSRVGVDPQVYSYSKFNPLQSKLESSGHQLVPITTNLIELIWSDRPARPTNPIKPLARNYTGKSVAQKLKEVNTAMKEKHAEYLVLSALDEIAYFLNLRGSDIEFNPVFFSYVIIGNNNFTVFLNDKQNSSAVKEHLDSEVENSNYKIENYDNIEKKIEELANKVEGYIWFSEHSSFALTDLVPKKHKLMTDITPICLMKGVKNETEIQGMRKCHIRDAAALCCYFAWLEANVKSEKITEISGADKLLEFRKMQKDFVGPSFATISSVGPHGAIIHYKPSHDTDAQITADQVYLCDSGGQYLDGTTDVTRTLHFGTPTPFEKECYTRVLKGQLKLGSRIYPSKIKGNCLDSFAREFLWQVGLDYGHGTGHGIGSYLNVHEGPMGISWRPIPEDPGLEPGMFISNEPGFYQDGEFGLRIEDIVQVVEAKPPHNFNNRGYLTFETITLMPKTNNLILVEMLTDEEIKQLNDYHKHCLEVVGAVLDKQGQIQAKEWLVRETKPLSR
ncbi:xaa-Pro aminopeptidase ApepP [Diabrotica undecimpunctata]|uniref:xaa-Pro aminopeptidase ApepP n=1 Tax=Diabrotica undecimpunctata TaxID=50387 RepID=UPI003B63E628